jgi:hypothetical protein
VAAFPALAAGYVPGDAAQALLDEAEASCFYHADKRAAAVCDQCGRFLCSLCDVRMGERHVCPACIEARLGGGAKKNTGERRFLHDSLALALATWPVLVWFTTPLTAPLAIFLAIRYWNAPGGLFRWRKVRLVAAIVLGGLHVAVWLFVLLGVVLDKFNIGYLRL